MGKNILGVILAALAMFTWGFIYWGATQLPYQSWKHTNDDEAAGQALLEHFPESGTYYLPGFHNDEKTIARLFEKGPVGFIHIIAREGRPQHDTSIMLKGFLLYLITAIVMMLLMKQVAPSINTFGSNIKFFILVGLAAALMIDFGDAVWWQIPWAWKIHQSFYNFAAFVIGGLVLGKFVKAD